MPRSVNTYQVWPWGQTAHSPLFVHAAGIRDAEPRIAYAVEHHRSEWIGLPLCVRRNGAGWRMDHQRARARRLTSKRT